jgi:hypothetical protein
MEDKRSSQRDVSSFLTGRYALLAGASHSGSQRVDYGFVTSNKFEKLGAETQVNTSGADLLSGIQQWRDN